MFRYELKPEIRKQMKDPDLFEKGLTNVQMGLVICMSGVGLMLYLYFNDPEKVLHPTYILFGGLALAGFGEWQKFKGK